MSDTTPHPTPTSSAGPQDTGVVEVPGLLGRVQRAASAVAEQLGAKVSGALDDALSRDDVEVAARVRAGMAVADTAQLAAFVHELQDGRTSRADEEVIRDILLSRTGAELTELKNAINSRTDQHDLEGLIFQDIDDETIRAEILDHFRAQVPAAPIGGGSPVREAKVLSDIDDTCISRIHETRWPTGIVVPGILALYEALDRGAAEQPVSRGDLTFVTARPGDALGLMEGHSRRALTEAGIAQMSVLTGGLLGLRSHDAMADKKMANIDHYAQLFPEYDLVFIGDSGQGDPIVGEQLLDKHAGIARLVLIHDVVATGEEERAAKRDKGIHYVDTYVGAAVVAHAAGLISDRGLREVIDETQQLTDEVAWDSPEQEQAMRALVARDVAAAEAVLGG